MRAWSAVCLLAVLGFVGCKHRGSSSKGSQPVVGSAAALIADQATAARQQADLLNLPTTEMETSVPPALQSAIPPWKDALVRLADDVLAGQPASTDAPNVQEALTAVMPRGKAPDDSQAAAAAKAAGKNEFEVPERGDFGGDMKVTVTAPAPGLLLVDESFGIQCGDDNILLGYSNAAGKWQRVLRWQAAPYKDVSGAFGDIFEPTLLQPRKNGHPVLLVVHGTPWCTSTESGFSMDTFEIDPTLAVEKPFWHREHEYRRADEHFETKATHEGFEIRTSIDDHIGDAINRTGILRYALTGDTFERVLPIAMNSRESVAEWLSMPREEAKRFTDASDGSATWQTWQALTWEGKGTDDIEKMPSLTYGKVTSCTDAKHFQVSVGTEFFLKGHENKPGPDYYFQVDETGNGYRVRQASTQPDSACNGKEIKLKSSGYESQAEDPNAQ